MTMVLFHYILAAAVLISYFSCMVRVKQCIKFDSSLLYFVVVTIKMVSCIVRRLIE